MKWRQSKPMPAPEMATEEQIGPHCVRVYRVAYQDMRTFYSAREVVKIGDRESWFHLATADTAEDALRKAAARLGYEVDE